MHLSLHVTVRCSADDVLDSSLAHGKAGQLQLLICLWTPTHAERQRHAVKRGIVVTKVPGGLLMLLHGLWGHDGCADSQITS